LKTMICMKYLLKLTHLTEKNGIDDPDCTHMVFNQEINLFVNSFEKAYLEKNEPFPTLNCLICRKVFFQKLPHLSNWRNVLDTAASNIGGFHCRVTCLPSTQLNRTDWCKESPPSPEMIWQKYSFAKLNQFSVWNAVLDTLCSIITGFVSRNTCVSST
jgi:hypothetical protein